ncbi:hypothetical protein T4B_2491 [Trichinella pseudospiralis]|uniref:Uncharacterized protein n=1 Tax=Trichinella pseudospiralis TaxID=6337 RepID=A0A0V1DT77_TRIPS|nr:hypothetical protein T4A_2759 [Trichinella pseudospiralis]KRY99694.1 hypothetical protein T4B_2491 [Trichinella pseudospiralis]KRZ40168.1 hypothetical protein T4C_9181 [Trichinella pseudospiralis]
MDKDVKSVALCLAMRIRTHVVMKRCCFCSNPEEIVTPKEKRLPSGEEATSSADRSDRSVEGGSGVLIHPGSSQRKS